MNNNIILDEPQHSATCPDPCPACQYPGWEADEAYEHERQRLLATEGGAKAKETQEEASAPRLHTIPCNHSFSGGLCVCCLCAETPAEEQRATNAYENYVALRHRWSDVLGRYVDEEDALFQAWQSHRVPQSHEPSNGSSSLTQTHASP